MIRRLLALLLMLSATFAAAGTPRIGVNLSPVNYWTPGQPFIDRMKVVGGWAAQRASEPLTLSAAGEPANFPAGATMIGAMVGMDSPGATFDLMWSGTATFQLQNATVLSTAPGKITFVWDPAGTSKGSMQLIIRSGVASDIHIVRDDQVALFQAGEQFRPEIVAQLKGMSHFRAMDWLQTNSTTATEMLIEGGGSYETRPVPLAAIVALANETGLRPWINLPANISDAGAVAAFDYLHAHLKPGIRPIVEYGNEIWNTGFPAAKAALLATTAKTGDGAYYYGLQLARVAKLARGREIGLVAMWQFVVPARFNDVYSGFRDGGGLDSDLEAIGGADYLNGTLTSQRLPDALALLAANDVAGALANVAASLPTIAGYHAAWAALAKAHGWKYWTYEGGNYHLNTIYFASNAEPLRAFYQTVQEDPRAAANLSTEIDNFAAAGGDAMTIYNLSSLSTTSGYFGITNTPGSWAMYRARLDARVANDSELQDLRAQVRALGEKIDTALAGR